MQRTHNNTVNAYPSLLANVVTSQRIFLAMTSYVARKRQRQNDDYDAVYDEEQTIENHRQLAPLGPRCVTQIAAREAMFPLSSWINSGGGFSSVFSLWNYPKGVTCRGLAQRKEVVLLDAQNGCHWTEDNLEKK